MQSNKTLHDGNAQYVFEEKQRYYWVSIYNESRITDYKNIRIFEYKHISPISEDKMNPSSLHSKCFHKQLRNGDSKSMTINCKTAILEGTLLHWQGDT